MYSIGQVAEMFGLPVSTLRYYDKQGLFPGMERSSGVRRFSEAELEKLRVIQCLKETGMEIRVLPEIPNIRRYSTNIQTMLSTAFFGNTVAKYPVTNSNMT